MSTDLVVRIREHAGAYLFPKTADALLKEAADNLERLTATLAIQTVNAKALIDEQTARQQAEVERDIAIQSIAELAETLRVVRNTQGGRFGLAWADVERMVNTTLGYPQQPDVTTLAASQTEMSPEAKRTLYGNMRDLYVSADDVPADVPNIESKDTGPRTVER